MGLNFTYSPGQTPLEEEEKDGLIPFWVNTMEELNIAEQQNINKAMIFFSKKSFHYKKIISMKFFKYLHKKMFSDVWKWAGKIRKTDKNIGVCKFRIYESTKNIIDDSIFWIENKVYSPIEICIRAKALLVKTHLFPNGNGRHSRLFADILAYSLGMEPFSWGNSCTERRESYLSALRLADIGKIKQLIDFSTS